jgi:predicted TIM-barrel fold metal-dependent hydrolase
MEKQHRGLFLFSIELLDDVFNEKKVIMKAIDVHGHFGVYDRGAGGLMDQMISGSIEVVRRRAQAANICLTVVSAIHALIPYGGDVLGGNEDACKVAEEYSDIRFWAVVNPRLPGTYKQAELLLTHPRCKGIKIHPTDHAYEIGDYGDEIFEFASSHKAIISTHSGCLGSFPEDFICFANQYPDVSLILAHLGNSVDGNLSRQIYALNQAKNGNVYIDTSSAKSINSGLIEWAVSEVGAQCLLFGTDTPLYFAASQKARIEYAEIDEGAKRAILFENAAKLLSENFDHWQ